MSFSFLKIISCSTIIALITASCGSGSSEDRGPSPSERCEEAIAAYEGISEYEAMDICMEVCYDYDDRYGDDVW